MGGRREKASAGGGFAGAIVLVFLLGVLVEFFWWFVAAGVLVGLFYAGRALWRHIVERREVAAHQAEELAYRADRQHRWARRGDSRGVYGVAGAELMRSISPEPPPTPSDEPQGETPCAGIVTTAEELAELLEAKAPCWPWAVFGSVLVQRQAAVAARLRDCRLGYTTQTCIRAHHGIDVAWFVTDHMDDLHRHVAQLDEFMLAPAFMEVFAPGQDDSHADADGVMHVAHRVMDYHERFLELAEHTRDFQAPTRYADLMRDCSRLMLIPLDGYRAFIDEFVERVAEMPELLRRSSGPVEADPVVLEMDLDDQLVKRITKQVRVAATRSTQGRP